MSVRYSDGSSGKAGHNRENEAAEQLLAACHRKLPSAMPASSEIVQRLPNNYRRVARRPNFGLDSSDADRSRPILGQNSRKNGQVRQRRWPTCLASLTAKGPIFTALGIDTAKWGGCGPRGLTTTDAAIINPRCNVENKKLVNNSQFVMMLLWRCSWGRRNDNGDAEAPMAQRARASAPFRDRAVND